jgi:hypothetical protein
VNGVHVCDFRRADDAIGAQVAVGTFGPADANCLVGELHVERLDVSFGIDRQGLDTHFATGTNDPERDFTAIGDENLLNHTGIKI